MPLLPLFSPLCETRDRVPLKVSWQNSPLPKTADAGIWQSQCRRPTLGPGRPLKRLREGGKGGDATARQDERAFPFPPPPHQYIYIYIWGEGRGLTGKPRSQRNDAQFQHRVVGGDHKPKERRFSSQNRQKQQRHQFESMPRCLAFGCDGGTKVFRPYYGCEDDVEEGGRGGYGRSWIHEVAGQTRPQD